MTEKETCIGNAYGECDSPAVVIRHTQFAGSHPLCLLHAMEDKHFMLNDSYTDWERIDDEV